MEIKRNEALEEALLARLVDSFEWPVLPEHVLHEEHQQRGDEIHMSDLLKPLVAFWKRKFPEVVTPREAQLFMYGRGFEVEMVRRSGLVPAVQRFSRTEPVISYRPDFDDWPGVFQGPIELKWRRANLAEPGNEADEYAAYTPQIMGYCAFGQADGVWATPEAKLIVNTPRQGQSAGDQFASTQPATRVYDLTFTDAELASWRAELIRRAEAFTALMQGRGNLRQLPLCPDWLCGSLKRTTPAHCAECDKSLVGKWEREHVNTKVGKGHTVTPPEFNYEKRCQYYDYCRPDKVDSSRGPRKVAA